MKLLSIADLCERWTYSKAGIHKLTKTSAFPVPFACVSRGKVKIFAEIDIVEYEKNKPWLFDVAQKRLRQNLYWWLSSAKDSDDPQACLNHLFGEKAKTWQS